LYSETYTAFRRLGHSIFNAIIAVLLINVSLSYSTQDSWIPDPFFTIKVKNIHRCTHRCDSGIFDNQGELNENHLNEVLDKFSNKNEVEFSDITRVITYPHGVSLSQTIVTFWGFICGRLEWLFACKLLKTIKGKVTKEDLKKIIDGSFFKETSRDYKNKQH
jgi:peroxygenase